MPYNTQIIGGTTNPYNAGAVVVNSEEPVKYFLAQKAHQAALDEAATKHSLDKINDFKPNEIRAVDTPGLLGITDKYRNHYIANQKSINNTSIDGGKSYLESKGIYNEGLLHSAKSKAAKLEEKAVADLHLADIKAGRETDPENAAIMEHISASVNDPNHYKDGAGMTQPYTSKDWKPYQGYGAKEMAAQLKQYEPVFTNNDAFEADGASTPSVDKTTGKKITIDPFRLSAKGMDDVKSIYDADWTGNPSTQTHAKDAFKTISNEVLSTGQSPTLLNLNKTYKEFVGKDLDPRDLKEIGLAQLLSKKSSQLKGIEYNDAGTVKESRAEKLQYEFDKMNMTNNFNNNQKLGLYKLQPYKYPQGTEIRSDGNIYTADGKGYNGMIAVAKEQIPQQVFKDIREGTKEDGTKYTEKEISNWNSVPIYVENGVPQYIKTEDNEKGGGYFPLVPNKKQKIGGSNQQVTKPTSSSTQQTKTVHKRKLGE